MILNYINGYYIIYISGGQPEKLLNACSAGNIEISKIDYVKNGYCFQISKKNYNLFTEYCKKYGCKFKIKKYISLMNDIKKLKYRYLFTSGVVFFAAYLIICSRYIWDISVEGNYTYTREDIVECISVLNVSDGVLISQINCEDIEKQIRNTYFDITWVSAEVKGTRLIIHIKENFDNYIALSEDEPYDIIANKSATISSIITRSGTPLVKMGDTVEPGDVLISGAVEVLDEVGEFARYEYVNSDGDIYGETKYEYNDELSFDYTVKIYTGKYYTGSFLRIFTKEFKTNIFAKKKENYDRFETFNQIILFRNFYLPIYYGRIQYKCFEVEEYTYSEEEAQLLAEDNLNYYIETLEDNDVSITDKDITYSFDDNTCYVSGTLTAIERIGSVHTITIQEEETNESDEYN